MQHHDPTEDFVTLLHFTSFTKNTIINANPNISLHAGLNLSKPQPLSEHLLVINKHFASLTPSWTDCEPLCHGHTGLQSLLQGPLVDTWLDCLCFLGPSL